MNKERESTRRDVISSSERSNRNGERITDHNEHTGSEREDAHGAASNIASQTERQSAQGSGSHASMRPERRGRTISFSSEESGELGDEDTDGEDLVSVNCSTVRDHPVRNSAQYRGGSLFERNNPGRSYNEVHWQRSYDWRRNTGEREEENWLDQERRFRARSTLSYSSPYDHAVEWGRQAPGAHSTAFRQPERYTQYRNDGHAQFRPEVPYNTQRRAQEMVPRRGIIPELVPRRTQHSNREPDHFQGDTNNRNDFPEYSYRPHETTSFGSSKLFKMEPFPTNKKPDEKYNAWLYWKGTFQLAMEKAGITNQRAKGVELLLHIGPELRRVMMAKDMLLDERDVEPGFPFYDYAVDHLEEYLRSLTDRAVDVVKFSNAKQEEGETTMDFEFRLSEMAKRTGGTQEMVRAQLIKGLRDQVFAKQMFIEGVSLQTIVTNATRQEAFQEGEKESHAAIWKGCNVAAVKEDSDRGKATPPSKSKVHGERQAPYRPRSLLARGRNLQRDNAQRGDNRTYGRRDRSRDHEEGKQCNRCGFYRHRGQFCPALEAKCNRCREIGHYEAKCTRRVNRVSQSDDEQRVREIRN